MLNFGAFFERAITDVFAINYMSYEISPLFFCISFQDLALVPATERKRDFKGAQVSYQIAPIWSTYKKSDPKEDRFNSTKNVNVNRQCPPNDMI